MPFPPLFIARRFFIRPDRQGLLKKTPLPLIGLSSFPRIFFFFKCFKMVSSFAFEGYFLLFERHKSEFKKIFQIKMLFSYCTIVKRHQNTFHVFEYVQRKYLWCAKIDLMFKMHILFCKKETPFHDKIFKAPHPTRE